jgi:hypothetical protein
VIEQHRILAGGSQRQLEVETFNALQVANDLEEIPRLGVPVGAEHAHKTLCRSLREPTQFLKADGGADVVAQDRLAHVEVSRQETFDVFAQEAPFGTSGLA